MRKIFNFIVLLIWIKRNNIKEDDEFYNSKLSYFYCSYYFDEKVLNYKIFFYETIKEDSIFFSLHYEVISGEYKFNLWNWQAKLLYKMAKNKYLKS